MKAYSDLTTEEKKALTADERDYYARLGHFQRLQDIEQGKTLTPEMLARQKYAEGRMKTAQQSRAAYEAQYPTPPAPQGMSTKTKLVIGALALGAGWFAWKKWVR